MTEAEWLTSTDPAAMLAWMQAKRRVPPAGAQVMPPPNVEVSDRKLRLFVSACMGGKGWEDWAERHDSFPTANGAMVAAGVKVGQNDPGRLTPAERARRAEILRSVVGNPWREVWVGVKDSTYLKPVAERGGTVAYVEELERRVERPLIIRRAWLTPDVLRLAHLAYDERPGRACGTCLGGTKPPYPYAASGWETCRGCDGTGRAADGPLDPVTLNVLADALVDAGVPEEEACGRCKGQGYIYRRISDDGVGRSTATEDCPGCHGAGRLPHPLLAALREPVARYRGFWALDVVLGRT